jgi:hypothetical protein
LAARDPVIDPYYAARAKTAKPQAAAGVYEIGMQHTPGVEDEGISYSSTANEPVVVDPESVTAGEEVAPEYIDAPYPERSLPHGGDGCVDGPCSFDGDDTAGLICDYGDCYLDAGHVPGAYCRQPHQGALWQQVHSHFRIWGAFNYLDFWVKGASVPPLVTTSPLGTPQSDAGVLGVPTTAVLFGNDRVNGDQRNGARIQAGIWLVDGEFLGIDGHYYALAAESTRFSAASDFSTPDPNAIILARPFFDISQDTQNALVLAYPNFVPQGSQVPVDLNGQVSVQTSSKVQSASLGLRHLVFIDFQRDCRLFLTGGYRFFRLDEDLSIFNQIAPVGNDFPAGTLFTRFDSFVTQSQFHGGYVGLIHDQRFGRVSLETVAQLAMGNVHEVVDINGQRTVFNGTTTTTSPGGLLAMPTNIGHHSRDQFALIPEVETKLGFQILPRLRLTAGYNFTYVTRVVRPGNEIDFAVNPNQNATQVIGPARPEVRFNATNIWIQGVTAGFEVRF